MISFRNKWNKDTHTFTIGTLRYILHQIVCLECLVTTQIWQNQIKVDAIHVSTYQIFVPGIILL